jgi:Glycosyltransferase Family 4
MSVKRKKVLLLIPNLTFGGAQRVFHDHSLLLSQHYEVIECVFNLETSHAFPSGNRLLSLDVKAGTNLFDKFFRFLQRVSRLRRIKEQYDIDICISHLEGADLVNILSRRREKIVVWIHGSKLFDQNISGILGFIRQRLLIPFAYSSADKVVCVSDAIQQELVNSFIIFSMLR